MMAYDARGAIVGREVCRIVAAFTPRWNLSCSVIWLWAYHAAALTPFPL
jgi:hypothetical protein